jgi:phage-related protein
MEAEVRWRLELFTTAAGRCPVQEYIEGLPSREASRVAYALRLLRESGIELGAPHARSLGGKLWELRVTGSLQHRVLYFAASGRRLILLHAFTKKTSRTPRTEIETARTRMTEVGRWAD